MLVPLNIEICSGSKKANMTGRSYGIMQHTMLGHRDMAPRSNVAELRSDIRRLEAPGLELGSASLAQHLLIAAYMDVQ